MSLTSVSAAGCVDIYFSRCIDWTLAVNVVGLSTVPEIGGFEGF